MDHVVVQEFQELRVERERGEPRELPDQEALPHQKEKLARRDLQDQGESQVMADLRDSQVLKVHSEALDLL